MTPKQRRKKIWENVYRKTDNYYKIHRSSLGLCSILRMCSYFESEELYFSMLDQLLLFESSSVHYWWCTMTEEGHKERLTAVGFLIAMNS